MYFHDKTTVRPSAEYGTYFLSSLRMCTFSVPPHCRQLATPAMPGLVKLLSVSKTAERSNLTCVVVFNRL